MSSEGARNGAGMEEWNALMTSINPIAAVVAADSEDDPMVRMLHAMGVHRLQLLLPDGSLLASESEWTASLPNISSIPLPPCRSCTPSKSIDIS